MSRIAVEPNPWVDFQNSYVDGPRLRRILSGLWRNGRVQSYVRPLGAVHLTAGPDGVRWSGPHPDCALRCAL